MNISKTKLQKKPKTVGTVLGHLHMLFYLMLTFNL